MEKSMYILVFFMFFSYTLVTKESKKIFHQEASMNLDIHICPTNLLTQKQLQEIADLTTFCHRHDGIGLRGQIVIWNVHVRLPVVGAQNCNAA